MAMPCLQNKVETLQHDMTFKALHVITFTPFNTLYLLCTSLELLDRPHLFTPLSAHTFFSDNSFPSLCMSNTTEYFKAQLSATSSQVPN